MRIIASTTDRDRGFTLVELLIVIVILGVLSSVSVFAVRGISSRGEASACRADVKTLETAIEVWRVQHPGTDTVSEDDLVRAGHLRSPSTHYDVIDALTIVPAAGSGCAALAAATSSPTTTNVSPTTTSGVCPGGWEAEWYSNRSLSGSPVATTCEAAINNTWAYNPPGVAGVPQDQFSVRWTRTITAATTGQYAFTAYTDDGIRVKLDGVSVIDSWRDQGTTRYDATANVTVGQHTVVVEFYENGGEATARVSYAPV